MNLKTCILAILLFCTINIVEAEKTSFYNKLEKQKKLDNEISTLLFLSAFFLLYILVKSLSLCLKTKKRKNLLMNLTTY